ncbi:MAG: hypothetical protein AB7P03_16915 [Kofleriaceae bacterium]
MWRTIPVIAAVLIAGSAQPSHAQVPRRAPPPPPGARMPMPHVNFDNRGWTMLGERDVEGRRRGDRDRIMVGRHEGRFNKLTIVVKDSDLEMIDFSIKFDRGPDWRPPAVGHYFRENSRTRVIDLPGDNRVIKYIDFRYRNLPGGGRAKVQVWAQQAAPPAPPPPRINVWDNRGWEKLGEQEVSGRGREDTDRIRVGRDEGRFRQLMIVVQDSDLELLDFVVEFGRGEAFRPGIRAVFREGTRTRAIDLPGDKRVIKSIQFKYRNLRGGGRAKIQVWGK